MKDEGTKSNFQNVPFNYRKALEDPKACDTGSAAIYGMAQSLPDRSIVDQITRAYLDSLYATNSDDN